MEVWHDRAEERKMRQDDVVVVVDVVDVVVMCSCFSTGRDRAKERRSDNTIGSETEREIERVRQKHDTGYS